MCVASDTGDEPRGTRVRLPLIPASGPHRVDVTNDDIEEMLVRDEAGRCQVEVPSDQWRW